MAIALQFSGFNPSNLKVTSSPLAELMALLHVWAEPDHHLEFSDAVQTLASGVDESLISEFQALSPLWARFRARFFFPLSLQLGSLFDRELAALAAMPVNAFAGMAAEALKGFSQGQATTIDVLSDSQAQRDFLDSCRARSASRFELAEQLVNNPQKFRSRIIRFCIECWNSFFAEEWESLYQEISGSAAQLTMKFKRSEPTSVIAEVGATAKAFPGAAEVRFDKLQQRSVPLLDRELLMIPSKWIGNHLTVKDHPGYPVIVHYPLQRDRDPILKITQVRERLQALSADSRMELFRHISAEPMTTSELASRMGQPAAQISRSLRVLREADLVVSERKGKLVYHRIDIKTVLSLGPDLLSTLTR